MVRLGIISDTHCFTADELPSTLNSVFKNVDLIIHAGDLVSIAVIQELESRFNREVIAVHGNACDKVTKRLLPKVQTLKFEDCKIGVIHAPPLAGLELSYKRLGWK